MEAAQALQVQVDGGHQPWWLSAPDVAAACTFGIPGTTVEQVDVDTYKVTMGGTGEARLVDLTRPVRPDGIWVVVSIMPA